MERSDAIAGQDEAPALQNNLTRRNSRPSFPPQLETEIGQLYLRALDEPVPNRLLTILRSGKT